MATEYRTIQGDTFDVIAYRLFEAEHVCGQLMQGNPEEMDTIFFEAGQTLIIPDIVLEPARAQLPPWYGDEND